MESEATGRCTLTGLDYDGALEVVKAAGRPLKVNNCTRTYYPRLHPLPPSCPLPPLDSCPLRLPELISIDCIVPCWFDAAHLQRMPEPALRGQPSGLTGWLWIGGEGWPSRRRLHLSPPAGDSTEHSAALTKPTLRRPLQLSHSGALLSHRAVIRGSDVRSLPVRQLSQWLGAMYAAAAGRRWWPRSRGRLRHLRFGLCCGAGQPRRRRRACSTGLSRRCLKSGTVRHAPLPRQHTHARRCQWGHSAAQRQHVPRAAELTLRNTSRANVAAHGAARLGRKVQYEGCIRAEPCCE